MKFILDYRKIEFMNKTKETKYVKRIEIEI